MKGRFLALLVLALCLVALAGRALPADLPAPVPYTVTVYCGLPVLIVPGEAVGKDRGTFALVPVVQFWLVNSSGADVPGPGPSPGPGPTPQPSPTQAALLYLLYDQPVTPEVARVKDAKAWRDAAAAGKLRVVELEASVLKGYPDLSARGAKMGLPCVIVADAKGLVLPGGEAKLPATPEDMTTLVKKWGGK